jgi:hypothetical protein
MISSAKGLQVSKHGTSCVISRLRGEADENCALLVITEQVGALKTGTIVEHKREHEVTRLS